MYENGHWPRQTNCFHIFRRKFQTNVHFWESQIILSHLKSNLPTFSWSTLLNIIQKLIIFSITITNYFNIDLFLITDVENNITMFLVLFDFFIRCLTDIGNSYSWCLKKLRNIKVMGCIQTFIWYIRNE